MSSLFENAARLVRREAPWFAPRLAAAQSEKTPLVLHLSEVEDNPLLLYGCVWIATRKKVAVLIDPASQGESKTTSD